MKCHHDSTTGVILGFFDPDIHATIPTPCVDLEPAQHAEVAAAPHKFRVALKTGKVEPYTPPPPTIDQMRTDAMRSADRIVDNAGKVVLGDTPAVIVEGYVSKAADAEAVINGTSRGGMVAAEAAITGEKPEDLACLIQANARPWQMFSAGLSGALRLARREITAAKSQTAIGAALNKLTDTCTRLVSELEG